MTAREEQWHRYVMEYDMDVPEEAIENELAYIKLDMRHRMQYDRLSGGSPHLFPQIELEQQEQDLRDAALFEAKASRVLKQIIAQQGFTASDEELAEEARAIAERQGSTIEMVKQFFGDDFKMLERDVLERKAMDWACEQVR